MKQNDILTNELSIAHFILPWDLLIGPILFQYLSTIEVDKLGSF